MVFEKKPAQRLVALVLAFLLTLSLANFNFVLPALAVIQPTDDLELPIIGATAYVHANNDCGYTDPQSGTSYGAAAKTFAAGTALLIKETKMVGTTEWFKVKPDGEDQEYWMDSN